MEKKTVLIIGVRRPCYKAARALGHNVVLWSDGALADRRKKGLHGWIEEPYAESKDALSTKLINELTKYQIDRVIANTEEAVLLGARVRAHLDLKRLAVDVVERFHNKWIMKNCAREMGVPVTNYRLIDQNTNAEYLLNELGLPLVIKPVDESGAQDIKIARNLNDIAKFIKPGLLAESYIEGSEVSVETFIDNGRPIFHNITEYLHQWRKSVVPANLSNDLVKKILKINDEVITHFGVDRGMTHAEFYITKNGPVFGEIAIRPPGGYYMNLIDRVYGIDSWKTYVNLSCGDEPGELSTSPKGCAAVYMIHPGKGRVKSITGVGEVKKHILGLFDISIRREPGDTIAEHENTSNEVGHVLFWASDRNSLNKDLNYIENTLRIELE